MRHLEKEGPLNAGAKYSFDYFSKTQLLLQIDRGIDPQKSRFSIFFGTKRSKVFLMHFYMENPNLGGELAGF